MAPAHQSMEHADHATHAAGHHKAGGKSRIYGVTMTLIGVAIAVSAALVGSQRNELTRAMIDQTQAHNDFTATSTKYRVVMIELEKQYARIVAARDPQGGASPVERFLELAEEYGEERRVARLWADSYTPLVDAHFEAAEGYEHAQLIAEIGIVLASLAVLLESPPAWVLSVLMSLLCLGQIGHTYFPTRTTVHAAEARIHEAEEGYERLRKAHLGANMDTAAIDRLDPGGTMRAAIKARRQAAPEPEPAPKHE